MDFIEIVNKLVCCIPFSKSCCLCGDQLGVDIGSSTVARGVVSLVLGYLNNLVIEMAFLIQVNQETSRSTTYLFMIFQQFYLLLLLPPQANTPEELPEFLLGTCRLNHLDASKSIPVKPPC